MGILPFELALTFYFAAVIIGAIELVRGAKGAKPGGGTEWLLHITAGVGFVNHTISIVYRYTAGGHLPITSPHEAASAFAWAIMLIYFIFEFRYKMGLMAAFVMPVVFLLMLVSSMLSRDLKPLSPTLQSYWLGVHTFFAFMANAAFALSFVLSIMYIVQDHYLKSKRLGGLFERLPSIQTLDYLNYRLITIGFPMMTLAIITGALWAEGAWGSYWRWDVREVWSLVIWLIYALILHARLVSGWRGKNASLLSIAGFVIIVLSFVGIRVLEKGLHVFK